MGQAGDLYARGWEDGVRHARRLMLKHQSDPVLAADLLAHQLAQAKVMREAAGRGHRVRAPDGYTVDP